MIMAFLLDSEIVLYDLKIRANTYISIDKNASDFLQV